MVKIIRWNPYREMSDIASMMNKMWVDAQLSDSGTSGINRWTIALDVIETASQFIVKASLPGVDPDEIDVSFVDDTLIIKGELKEYEAKEGDRYHLRERRFGKYERALELPKQIDRDNIQAHYASGVLTLMLPKSEEAKAKRVVVKPGEPADVLEGKFENLTSKN